MSMNEPIFGILSQEPYGQSNDFDVLGVRFNEIVASADINSYLKEKYPKHVIEFTHLSSDELSEWYFEQGHRWQEEKWRVSADFGLWISEHEFIEIVQWDAKAKLGES